MQIRCPGILRKCIVFIKTIAILGGELRDQQGESARWQQSVV